ncbi:hypothetical protein LY76DRAFT_31949 [Colletotrichum caudatum]|nr:hypothetical protein LY76DRAFT_31949 [Colletotrichum caudatum]
MLSSARRISMSSVTTLCFAIMTSNHKTFLSQATGQTGVEGRGMRLPPSWIGRMADMFPFAYEFDIKDSYLGSDNIFFSWYRLSKNKTAELVPAGDAHDKLIKAMRAIFKLGEKTIPGNIGVYFGRDGFGASA